MGTFAYVNSETGAALCLDCASQRGMTSKQRVKQLLVVTELKEDIKALKKEKDIRLDAIHMLEKQIDLYRLGERDLELEKEIVKLMNQVQEYVKKIATKEEKEMFNAVWKKIDELKDLQKDVRDHIEQRMYWFENPTKKKKLKRALNELGGGNGEEDEEETEEEAQEATEEKPAETSEQQPQEQAQEVPAQ
jgi:hypothetical protein